MDTYWIHCNQCAHNTKHEIVSRFQNDDYEVCAEGYAPVDDDIIYRILVCCGCGEVSFERSVYIDEVMETIYEYFPPRIWRPLPRWHSKLPSKLSSLMEEVYVALQAGSKRLAIMGARSLIEGFMNDKLGGDIRGFAKKTKELVTQGFLSSNNKQFLDAALETGHAVTHRELNPKARTVEQVIDIVEHLLQTYALEEAAGDLEDDTSPSNWCRSM